MESPDRYREFAAECYRLASDAKTEADWKTLLEIARAWKAVAEEVETKTPTSANAACHNLCGFAQHNGRWSSDLM
jgi:hypothetical protein